LIRKMTRVDSVVGLTTETMLLAPLAAGYVVWLMARGEATFGGTWDHLDWLLLAAGVVTSLPLLWFVNAARLLPLSRVGLMQYIAPTLQFLLAVLAYREPFTRDHLVSFGLVWTGLAVFVWDSLRAARLTAQPVAAEPVEAPAVAGACCGGGAR
jgi:chloramphenicol-sensitive protein RarD